MRKRHKTRVPGIYYRETDIGARRYIVWYQDALGQAHTETLPLGSTLEDAKARQGELRATKLIPTRQTVDVLLSAWLDRRRPGLAPGTLTIYTWGVERLKKDIGHLRVADLTADSLVALRQKWVKEGYKKNTISKIETPLRMALKAAARDGHIQASPYDKLLHHERVRGDQKEMRCLSSDEVKRLLKHGQKSNDPYGTLFAFLIFTGLRISEALQLSWDDVDLSAGLVHVRKGKTPNARRSVMLIDALRRLLTAFKLQDEPGHQFVFRTSHSRARHALDKACKAAGIERCSLHELRHTFASMMIANGEPVTFVAQQMGHRDPAITLKVYAHLFNEQDQIDQARERLQAAYGGLV